MSARCATAWNCARRSAAAGGDLPRLQSSGLEVFGSPTRDRPLWLNDGQPMSLTQTVQLRYAAPGDVPSPLPPPKQTEVGGQKMSVTWERVDERTVAARGAARTAPARGARRRLRRVAPGHPQLEHGAGALTLLPIFSLSTDDHRRPRRSASCSAHAATEADVELLRDVPARYQRLAAELGKRIIGQDEIIRDLFVALAVQGHVLMIGVPGLAKTLLVRSLAEILELQFQRIQFTPDLMPSDITGTEILEEAADGKREFRFVPGPIFANLLLADEINRTPPKTQAALLEAMQERHVTVAGRTYALPSPFFVLATQNPIEQEGTYPLPEAQLDRFMFNLRVDYPSHAEEVRILLETTTDTAEPMEKVWSGEEMIALQRAVRQVPVPPSVAEYAVSLVQATRPNGADAAGFCQALPAMGRGAARVAVPRARGQGIRRAGRAFQRRQGGHPARGQARAAAPAHRQLSRRGGSPDRRWDHRPTPGEHPVSTLPPPLPQAPSPPFVPGRKVADRSHLPAWRQPPPATPGQRRPLRRQPGGWWRRGPRPFPGRLP